MLSVSFLKPSTDKSLSKTELYRKFKLKKWHENSSKSHNKDFLSDVKKGLSFCKYKTKLFLINLNKFCEKFSRKITHTCTVHFDSLSSNIVETLKISFALTNVYHH